MKYFFCRVKPLLHVMLLGSSLFLTSSSFGAILIWDANREVDLAGYNLYYGTSPRNYTFVVNVGNVTDYNLNYLMLKEAVTYYVALTSCDISGNESDLSEELDYFAEDEIPEDEDNCSEISNPDQEDSYPPGGNSIGDACECEGDFDCDGNVDRWDGMLFEANYGRNLLNNPCNTFDPCPGDFDCDGDVDGWDSMVFKADYGRNQYVNSCPTCDISDWCSY